MALVGFLIAFIGALMMVESMLIRNWKGFKIGVAVHVVGVSLILLAPWVPMEASGGRVNTTALFFCSKYFANLC